MVQNSSQTELLSLLNLRTKLTKNRFDINIITFPAYSQIHIES